MPVIRRYSPATDSALKCEGCFRQQPEIVVEGYPSARDEPKALCYSCAVVAFKNNSDLVAHAVLTLILGTKVLE